MEAQSNSFLHFMHEHPLAYANLRNRTCSACNLSIAPGKLSYHCKICKFSLHKICYNMPETVLHPVDPNHHLFLSPTKTPSTECEACGRCISGFSYTCAKCNRYFHILCIAMPLLVKIPTSHPHLLKLELKPAYDFQCDLCEKPSYTGWLYHCRLCEFDAHISCAVTLKDMRSPRLSSVPENVDESLDGEKRIEANSHQHELMELLSEGMKEYNMKIFNVKDQPSMISEDFTLISYQFSDACFSIDIANSFRTEENKVRSIGGTYGHELKSQESQRTGIDPNMTDDAMQRGKDQEIIKKLSFDSGNRSPKRQPSAARISNGIGSHVWTELDQENKKEKMNAANETMKFKDPNTKVESVHILCL